MQSCSNQQGHAISHAISRVACPRAVSCACAVQCFCYPDHLIANDACQICVYFQTFFILVSSSVAIGKFTYQKVLPQEKKFEKDLTDKLIDLPMVEPIWYAEKCNFRSKSFCNLGRSPWFDHRVYSAWPRYPGDLQIKVRLGLDFFTPLQAFVPFNLCTYQCYPPPSPSRACILGNSVGI